MFGELTLKIKPFDLPGHQRFGAMWTSKDLNLLDQDPRIQLPRPMAMRFLRGKPILRLTRLLGIAGSLGDPDTQPDDWCFYYNFDQYLYVRLVSMTIFRSLSLRGLCLFNFASDRLGFGVWLAEERLLPRQLGLNLPGQLKPIFLRPGLEVSQRTDDLLPRPLGCMPRFDEQMVGVGLAPVLPGRGSDVHGHYIAISIRLCQHKSESN